jgi:hypothetical protein
MCMYDKCRILIFFWQRKVNTIFLYLFGNIEESTIQFLFSQHEVYPSLSN